MVRAEVHGKKGGYLKDTNTGSTPLKDTIQAVPLWKIQCEHRQSWTLQCFQLKSIRNELEYKSWTPAGSKSVVTLTVSNSLEAKVKLCWDHWPEKTSVKTAAFNSIQPKRTTEATTDMYPSSGPRHYTHPQSFTHAGKWQSTTST